MIRHSICLVTIALAQAILMGQSIRQADQVLYESAITDIQQNHFERARLTLQTLTNTYDNSPFLADAKLAIADSWYREGGTRGLAQAEAECLDLIMISPNTPTASQAQQLLRGIQDARTANATGQSARQPDQILYESAISDIQGNHFERARLTLQTLINTYDSSAFLTHAKLAIADSWYREGGTHGLAQAEAECKDLIMISPDTPTASQAQQLLRKIQEARSAK